MKERSLFYQGPSCIPLSGEDLARFRVFISDLQRQTLGWDKDKRVRERGYLLGMPDRYLAHLASLSLIREDHKKNNGTMLFIYPETNGAFRDTIPATTLATDWEGHEYIPHNQIGIGDELTAAVEVTTDRKITRIYTVMSSTSQKFVEDRVRRLIDAQARYQNSFTPDLEFVMFFPRGTTEEVFAGLQQKNLDVANVRLEELPVTAGQIREETMQVLQMLGWKNDEPQETSTTPQQNSIPTSLEQEKPQVATRLPLVEKITNDPIQNLLISLWNEQAKTHIPQAASLYELLENFKQHPESLRTLYEEIAGMFQGNHSLQLMEKDYGKFKGIVNEFIALAYLRMKHPDEVVLSIAESQEVTMRMHQSKKRGRGDYGETYIPGITIPDFYVLRLENGLPKIVEIVETTTNKQIPMSRIEGKILGAGMDRRTYPELFKDSSALALTILTPQDAGLVNILKIYLCVLEGRNRNGFVSNATKNSFMITTTSMAEQHPLVISHQTPLHPVQATVSSMDIFQSEVELFTQYLYRQYVPQENGYSLWDLEQSRRRR